MWLNSTGTGRSRCQPQNTEVMAYLDGLLAALDLLYLSLGQGDPLPNGLQLAPTQLYSLGDPIKEKCQDWGLLQVLRPLYTSANSTPEPVLSTRHKIAYPLCWSSCCAPDPCLPMLFSPMELTAMSSGQRRAATMV